MRHPRIATLAALLGGLVLATATLAGGGAQVTLTDVPHDPPAGTGVLVGFEVMQHGETPVSWPKVTVIATNTSTGDIVRTAATAQGPVGAYVATITFPVEGAWVIAFDSADLIMSGTGSLDVAPAATASAASTPAAPVELAPLALTGLLALIVGLGGAWFARARRGRRDQPATLSS